MKPPTTQVSTESQLRLVVGMEYLNSPASTATLVELRERSPWSHEFHIEELRRSELGALAPYRMRVAEVLVGYCEWTDMEFIRWLPNVKDVWIKSPSVCNISGLASLRKIEKLALDRPTCRMDVLGQLASLRELYLDDWRPGAESIFALAGLVKIGVQKYKYRNLQGMECWQKLHELWLNSGNVENLSGIPRTVENLRLTNLRKLTDLTALTATPFLKDLRLEGCKQVNSLAGLEGCRRLRLLAIARGGAIASLEPLRNLDSLEYIAIADGTFVENGQVDALYSLPNLSTLIISKKSGVDLAHVIANAPNCKVQLARS
jgi:hypothetical protein